jgi:hypothetical protein
MSLEAVFAVLSKPGSSGGENFCGIFGFGVNRRESRSVFLW